MRQIGRRSRRQKGSAQVKVQDMPRRRDLLPAAVAFLMGLLAWLRRPALVLALGGAEEGELWSAEVSSASSASAAAVAVGEPRPMTSSFRSVGEALAAAPAQATSVHLLLQPGIYRERLTLGPGRRVALEAAKPGTASLIWETERPYEAVVKASAGATVTLTGLVLRHASKSVANNYAVHSEGADLTLQGCDIFSSTGAGVAAEGGRLTIRNGLVHDCARQGVVLFGPLLGGDPLQMASCGAVLRGNGKYAGDGDAIRGPFDGMLRHCD